LNWYKVNLTCNNVDANLIEEILVGYEAISISMFDENGDSQIYEPGVGKTPLWNIIRICALFDKNITKEIIVLILKGIPYTNLNISSLEDQNWVKKYQENFKPIKYGERLWVVPSWCSDFKKKGSVIMKLDPGMAFGSGSHETTHLCLEHLEKTKLDGLTILDYGCGSGILSIASLVLGAKRAIATDIDPQALKSTKENSRNNNVVDKLDIVQPDSIPNIKIDLLLANIFSNILIDCRNTFSNILEPEARIVLSGIMKNQLKIVVEYYDKFFTMEKVEIRKDWCLVELKRNNNLANENS